MPDHSTCPSCGVWADGAVAACPRCGTSMQLKKAPTTRGWLLIVIGLFLVLFMGAITIAMAPTMLHPGEQIDGSSFTGTSEQARTFFLIFALVILVGLISLAYGIFQVVTRRESVAFIALSLGVAGLLVAVVVYVLATEKPADEPVRTYSPDKPPQ